MRKERGIGDFQTKEGNSHKPRFVLIPLLPSSWRNHHLPLQQLNHRDDPIPNPHRDPRRRNPKRQGRDPYSRDEEARDKSDDLKKDSTGGQVDSGTWKRREDDWENRDALEDDKEIEEEDDGWRCGKVDRRGGGDIWIDVVGVDGHLGEVGER